MEIAPPNTVVPTRANTAVSLSLNPNPLKIRTNIKSTMKLVPETGSILVSPITLTAIAPNAKVVKHRTSEKISEAKKPNCVEKAKVIPISETINRTGMWLIGHSYQPFPST